MKKLMMRFVLFLVFISFYLWPNQLYAGSPNVLFIFDMATPINGVVPQAKAQSTLGAAVLQLEVRSVNLPDGTALNVIFTEHERTAPYAALAPVTIGTIILVKGQAKADLNWAGLVPGTIDGLLITGPDGALLLHAFPMFKN